MSSSIEPPNRAKAVKNNKSAGQVVGYSTPQGSRSWRERIKGWLKKEKQGSFQMVTFYEEIIFTLHVWYMANVVGEFAKLERFREK